MIDLSKLDPTDKKEAIELLKKMGYDIEGDVSKKIVRVKVKLKSYICRYEISCETCHNVYFESYIMTPDIDHKYLFSRPIEEKEIKIEDKKSLDAAGNRLLKIMNLNAVLITRGEAGMALFVKGKRPEYIPTRAQEVFDVSGAGDTVIGAFTLALSCGASFNEAAHISNYAAGIVVGKLGVGSCSQKELIE